MLSNCRVWAVQLQALASLSLLSLVLASVCPLPLNSVATCITIKSWNDFVSVVKSGTDRVKLCPFSIDKLTPHALVIDKPIHIVCRRSTPADACRINGVGIHLAVEVPNGRAIFQDLTFRGSTVSAVYVKPTALGETALCSCNFQSNVREDNIRGGALKTEKGTGLVHVESCSFWGNSAVFGSAIYNRGKMIIERSKFVDNDKKLSFGGAIINANYADLTIRKTLFLRNKGYALVINPSGAGTGTIIDDGGNDSKGAEICDGIWDNWNKKCIEFYQSRLPTWAPSPAPTGIPSKLPTNVPSSLPSNVPSSEPSSMPSCMVEVSHVVWNDRRRRDLASDEYQIESLKLRGRAGKTKKQKKIRKTMAPVSTEASGSVLESPSAYPSSLNDESPLDDIPSRRYRVEKTHISMTNCPEQPTGTPSETPSFSPSTSHVPSNTPSWTPSESPSISFAPTKYPSFSPTEKPSLSPSEQPSISLMPSAEPSTDLPSTQPSYSPSEQPSISFSPSAKPSTETQLAQLMKFRASIEFSPGDLNPPDQETGLLLAQGLNVRILATAHKPVTYTSPYAKQTHSDLLFHQDPDGAEVFETETGGWIYMSNSESILGRGRGGVYAIEFDSNGEIVSYEERLAGTTRNCQGGRTPWETYLSCEEYGRGQCWQVDPAGIQPPKVTKLGGVDGGNFEATACDDHDPLNPIFFLTEDHWQGALRRYKPNAAAHGVQWGLLHQEDGITEYLKLNDDGTFIWTESKVEGQASANKYFRNTEGIHYQDRTLYFVSKIYLKLFTLDLDKMTWISESTQHRVSGDGSFTAQPDIITMTDSDSSILYFSEDGGRTPGVYMKHMDTGLFYTIFEAWHERFKHDETTGIAFSPDKKRFYSCMQEEGILYEFTRADGYPFDGTYLNLKYHNPTRRLRRAA